MYSFAVLDYFLFCLQSYVTENNRISFFLLVYLVGMVRRSFHLG